MKNKLNTFILLLILALVAYIAYIELKQFKYNDLHVKKPL